MSGGVFRKCPGGYLGGVRGGKGRVFRRCPRTQGVKQQIEDKHKELKVLLVMIDDEAMIDDEKEKMQPQMNRATSPVAVLRRPLIGKHQSSHGYRWNSNHSILSTMMREVSDVIVKC